ncbi:MAG: hypothetical protein HY343_03025, partial [Lentisphaerae bacterium]|nr:hypothetical protein [Lentisphaerota bacterium]
TDRPWLYASGYRGLRMATLRLNFLKPLASTPATGAVSVDGKLDEACWGDVFQSTNNAPLLPYTGARVAFRHDGRNLYVGVQRPPMVFKSPRAHWTPALGSGTSAFKSEPRAWQKGASKPDALSPKDNWWRLIVGDRAGGKAVYLTVTPDGTRADARVGPAGSGAGPSGVGTSPSGVGTSPSGIGTNATTNGMDLAWTAPWESAVMAGTNGMTVEMAIPWATLEAAGLNKDQLAVNFMMLDPDIGTEALTYLGIGGYDHCSNFTPLSLGKPAAVPQRPFTVRLHFAEPDADAKPGQRVFDVKLQDQVVLKGLDVVKEAKAPQTALVKEFKGVKAGEALTLEFVPVAQELKPANAPILCALEVVEEGAAGK